VNAYPGERSGGMRQRVNVARALVVEPDFLLMDEPFAALDAQTREIMQQELLRILAQTMVGVVFVTHQIEEALYLADRVVVMGTRPGRIRDEVRVPFSRPRSLALKRDGEFQNLYGRIWKSIESDVLASLLPAEGLSAGEGR
jgi:ABC-type nitrate/sulfonate/bicarbonate transport system ATPase subunit